MYLVLIGFGVLFIITAFAYAFRDLKREEQAHEERLRQYKEYVDHMRAQDPSYTPTESTHSSDNNFGTSFAVGAISGSAVLGVLVGGSLVDSIVGASVTHHEDVPQTDQEDAQDEQCDSSSSDSADSGN